MDGGLTVVMIRWANGLVSDEHSVPDEDGGLTVVMIITE